MWPGTVASFAVTGSTRANLRNFWDHMWEADAQPDNSGQNSRWDTPIVVSFSGTHREEVRQSNGQENHRGGAIGRLGPAPAPKIVVGRIKTAPVPSKLGWLCTVRPTQ